ncbi:MAG: metallophosphoesterase family protein [Candidatus Aenigmarchaeota archaeon]|nr:metallophosphoesterase family protein [Candidatus Aenigmarchaeota archaeon]
MVKIAVVSDIHSNWPALRAVLDDLGRHGYDLLVCAGDIVGYGAFPNECLDALRKYMGVCVAGNHDDGVRSYRKLLNDGTRGTEEEVRRALKSADVGFLLGKNPDFDRHQLSYNFDAHTAAMHNAEVLTPENAEYLENLSTAPYFDSQKGFGLVHGSFSGRESSHPRNRFEGIYVTDESLARMAMQNMFFYTGDDCVHVGLGLVGHTHVPMISSGWINYDNFDFMERAQLEGGQFKMFFSEGDVAKSSRVISIEQAEEPVQAGFWKRKVLFNPGSVGQPRHGSPRACYGTVYIEGEHITVDFREVEYPIEEAQEKMAEDKLRFSEDLIKRLERGR